jgi:hypothetical protein
VTTVLNGQTVEQLPYDVSGATSAADGTVLNDGGVQAQGESAASSDGLSARGFAVIESDSSAPLGFTLQRSGRGTAVATYTDVVVSGPPGPVTAAVNMRLGGDYVVASTATADGGNSGSALVQVTFRVNNVALQDPPGLGTSGSQTYTSAVGAAPQYSADLGALAGWRLTGGAVTSPTFQVTAGTRFTLEIELTAIGAAAAGPLDTTLTSSGDSDFRSALRFSTTGPVFALPAGYSARSFDARIADNVYPCVGDACGEPDDGDDGGGGEPPVPSTCDAGKLKCVAKLQACLLKVHAAAKKSGVPVNGAALDKCRAAFDGGAKGVAKGCLGKLEAKQNPAKPKTLCTFVNQLTTLDGKVGTFVTAMADAIDPRFPLVVPPTTCDAGKQKCVATRATCLLREESRAVTKGIAPDPVRLQRCRDAFNGGIKGIAKGCIGKLEAKQNPDKPKTACAVTGTLGALESAVDGFVTDAVATIGGP